MKKILKYLTIIGCVVSLYYLALYTSNDIGVSRANIEKDARSSHKILDHWKVTKDTTEKMSAMIFYNEDLSDHTFSMYVNRPGLSFGYFFRYGGSLYGGEERIVEVYIDGYNERAFFSMNKQKVSKVEIGNDSNIKTM